MLIGQQTSETLLARALLHDRVAHAYLFLGPPGSGKATAARLFAQAINCAQQPAVRQDQLAPCGECESCRRILADTHPEVLEVHPDSKTGQDISVLQARQIRKDAALRPKLGERRVYIFSNAEALNEVSGNALLKTLEEPSPFVTLILCAPNPSQVLPTIRSRCQLVRFGLASPREVAEGLVARGTDPERAMTLARACGGRPGLAISWSDNPSVLEGRRGVLDVFAEAVRRQREARKDPAAGIHALRLAERLRGLAGADREDDEGPARPAKLLHSDNLEIGLTYLRDLLLLAHGADPDLAQNQDRIPELREVAETAETGKVLEQIDSVREAQQLLDRNVAPQLVLERMFWALISGAFPVANPLFETSSRA